jgi:hypothetical protein
MEQLSKERVFNAIFVVCGCYLIGLGLYFALIRPALLPEDLRYIGATIQEIRSATPGVFRWLHRVFSVMGGFMVGFGILLISMVTGVGKAKREVFLIILAAAGASTVGIMSLTNFQLGSDSRWLLTIPVVLWLVGLAMRRSPS